MRNSSPGAAVLLGGAAGGRGARGGLQACDLRLGWSRRHWPGECSCCPASAAGGHPLLGEEMRTVPISSSSMPTTMITGEARGEAAQARPGLRGMQKAGIPSRGGGRAPALRGRRPAPWRTSPSSSTAPGPRRSADLRRPGPSRPSSVVLWRRRCGAWCCRGAVVRPA